MKGKIMKWFKEVTGELVGDFEANCMPSSYGGNCICPLCGQEATWWQGQIDETPMGEAIYGENQVCYACGIGTEVYELDEPHI